jgi:uncharacterized membrane protein
MKKRTSGNQIKTIGAVEKNITAIQKLQNETQQGISSIEYIAHKISAFAGSSPFIVLHLLWFGAWIFINSGSISKITPFDPFPFSFLTLIVSLESIFLTLLVLMSQNRMTKEADKRAHLDLQINLLDEQETTMILRLVQKITLHLGIEEEIDESINDLSETTDINQVAKKIDESSFP